MLRNQIVPESNVLNSRAYWQIDDKSELMGVFNFVYAPVAEDPGGLTAQQQAEDRRQAAARKLEFDVWSPAFIIPKSN